MDGINFFYQGSGIKILGEMGLRDLNNGKKTGINGSRTYHVTTLFCTSNNTSILSTKDLLVKFEKCGTARLH